MSNETKNNMTVNERLSNLEDKFVSHDIFLKHSMETKYDIQKVQNSLNSLNENLAKLSHHLDILTDNVKDPLNGLIVSNTTLAKSIDDITKINTKQSDQIDILYQKINKLKEENLIHEKFRKNVSKGLWIVYTSMVGIIITLFLQVLSK